MVRTTGLNHSSLKHFDLFKFDHLKFDLLKFDLLKFDHIIISKEKCNKMFAKYERNERMQIFSRSKTLITIFFIAFVLEWLILIFDGENIEWRHFFAPKAFHWRRWPKIRLKIGWRIPTIEFALKPIVVAWIRWYWLFVYNVEMIRCI